MANTSMISQIVQNTFEEQLNESQEPVEKLDFDPLQIFFGDDYKVNDKITIHQPRVQDFIDYGEDNIYGVIAPFVANTTSQRVQLWDLGIDWNTVTEQELFAFLIKTINPEYSHIIFGDFDIRSFDIYVRKTDGDDIKVLYSPILQMEISEEERIKMCKYIQYMFNTFPPEPEFTSNKVLKEELVNNDRIKQMARKREAQTDTSVSLLSKISFCLNHPGFKYKRDELRDMGFVEFLDSVQRLQIYESTHALLIGANSGFIDTKKIDKNEFNFMREVKFTA